MRLLFVVVDALDCAVTITTTTTTTTTYNKCSSWCSSAFVAAEAHARLRGRGEVRAQQQVASRVYFFITIVRLLACNLNRLNICFAKIMQLCRRHSYTINLNKLECLRKNREKKTVLKCRIKCSSRKWQRESGFGNDRRGEYGVESTGLARVSIDRTAKHHIDLLDVVERAERCSRRVAQRQAGRPRSSPRSFSSCWRDSWS